MARVALVIGTGEYSESFKPLFAAPKDAEAVAEVLQNPEMGGFAQVETLINPLHTEMSEKIETWFREQQKDDLALLYISGHGVKDAQRELYFAACNSRKQKEELVRSTAVSASFVRDCIRNSRAKRQVIILDCCFSGAFGDLLAKDDDTVNLENLLGAEGRVVLTSSSSLQYSFEQKNGGLSIYTHYLVEGIRTGAADLDGDGAISVQELHHYTNRKVQEERPAMNPKIIVLKDEGYQIRIAKAPFDQRQKYREAVEEYAKPKQGKLSAVDQHILKFHQQELGLSFEEARQITNSVLQPYEQLWARLQMFEQTVQEVVKGNPSIDAVTLNDLRCFMQKLQLRHEDIASIAMKFGVKFAQSNPTMDLGSSIVNHQLTSEFLLDDNLASEKGISYIKLRDLLESKEWKAADWETSKLLRDLAERTTDRWLRVTDVSSFPATDLRTINQLWVKYSNVKFGFSIQKQIWRNCGSPANGGENWNKFGDAVGWRRNGQWDRWAYSTDPSVAPQGHFPRDFAFGLETGGAARGRQPAPVSLTSKLLGRRF